MTASKWEFEGREFVNCNCAYGCPCQFNALPTYGDCKAIGGYLIDKGTYGAVNLDGLRVVSIYQWPGPIHEGRGEAVIIIDKHANDQQRDALLRIFSGEDTDPGATMFQVFSTTLNKMHDPVFADIDFSVDVDRRRAQLKVDGLVEAPGEPVVNPATGEEHRACIDLPAGFEYTLAETGRGWSKSKGAIPLDLSDSYGQFARLHLSEHGIVH